MGWLSWVYIGLGFIRVGCVGIGWVGLGTSDSPQLSL